METTKVRINNKEYEVLIAESEEEKEIGLQDVEDLEGQGMLFVYEEPQHLDF